MIITIDGKAKTYKTRRGAEIARRVALAQGKPVQAETVYADTLPGSYSHIQTWTPDGRYTKVERVSLDGRALDYAKLAYVGEYEVQQAIKRRAP